MKEDGTAGDAPPCTTTSTVCSNIGVNLQALGYDTQYTQSTDLKMDFNMVMLSYSYHNTII